MKWRHLRARLWRRGLFRARGVVSPGILDRRRRIHGIAFELCIFGMPVVGNDFVNSGFLNAFCGQGELTFRSSQPWTFLMPSPTSLKPSLVSSSRSCTLSLTRSVSRFVPSSDICCDKRDMLDVSSNKRVDSVSVRCENSGSSR